jgi:GNAT superfamily N-acetyltransferase
LAETAADAVTIRALAQADARELAPLLAAYAQAMRRGAPRPPDEFYAEVLTADRAAEIIGAFAGGALVGFAVFFDVPDTITGRRTGQLEDIYVLPAHRKRGLGRALVQSLRSEGQRRGWSRLRWIIPKPVDAAATGMTAETALYEDIGTRSEQQLYDVPIEKRV